MLPKKRNLTNLSIYKKQKRLLIDIFSQISVCFDGKEALRTKQKSLIDFFNKNIIGAMPELEVF